MDVVSSVCVHTARYSISAIIQLTDFAVDSGNVVCKFESHASGMPWYVMKPTISDFISLLSFDESASGLSVMMPVLKDVLLTAYFCCFTAET